jgi:pyrroloquinoline quinone biosynthesis protein E
VSAPRPFTLVAELTHACPLRCAHCSNPVDLAPRADELDTATWGRVLAEAEDLGVVQVHLSGGEPLLRPDLEVLVARARALDLYVSLITSGVPLTRERLSALAAAGLAHVQVSVQHAQADDADRLAGVRSFERKLAALRWAKEEGLRLTLNVVLTRDSIGAVADLVALAESAGADRLELANVQMHGFALANRAALLPDREAIEGALEIARAARERLSGAMEVLFVKPDHYSYAPRACLDGWARRYVVVAPDGRVLPCHAATSIAGLTFESVRDRPLAAIWSTSPALQRFRGEAWMQEPCRTCPERARDFGGCRCQAFALTGDPAATDPACALSPHRPLLEAAKLARAPRSLVHRGSPSR